MTRPREEDVGVYRRDGRWVLRFEDGSTAIARSDEDALAIALAHALDRGEVVVGNREKPVMGSSWGALPYLIASGLFMAGIAAAIWRAL